MASRTTLSIDDDMLCAARAIAERERRSMGDVVSELMRKGLRQEKSGLATHNGLPVIPVSNPDAVVTLEIVNRLRDSAA